MLTDGHCLGVLVTYFLLKSSVRALKYRVGLDSTIKASVSLFSRRPWLMLGANTGNGFFLLTVLVAIYRTGGPGTVSMEGVSH